MTDQSKPTTELKPCPFCSSEVNLITRQTNLGPAYHIECRRCYITTPSRHGKSIPVEHWNTHANLVPVAPNLTCPENVLTKPDNLNMTVDKAAALTKVVVHSAIIKNDGTIIEQPTEMYFVEPPPEKRHYPETDKAEIAYWNFDARRKGYGPWKLQPQSERMAFKTEYCAVLQQDDSELVKALNWARVLIKFHVKPGSCVTIGDDMMSSEKIHNELIIPALTKHKAQK